MIRVIKKDGTKEDFNVQKVVVAVNKSAYRALIKFTDEELDYICRFVEEKVQTLGIQAKHIFFVPMRQDNAQDKPTSIVADFSQLLPAAKAALNAKQLQPVLLG